MQSEQRAEAEKERKETKSERDTDGEAKNRDVKLDRQKRTKATGELTYIV